MKIQLFFISLSMMKISRDTWKNAYRLPLHVDKFGAYVYCRDRVTALSHFNVEKNIVEDIVSIINGKKTHYGPGWKVDEEDPCAIRYRGGEIQFLVRGWGHLTGCGAMKLDSKTAAAIQDQFIVYTLKRLNRK